MSIVEVNAAIKKFLDEVLLKKGKVIGITKTDGGWRVKVEIIEAKEVLRWASYPKVSDRDIYEIVLNDSFEVVSHSLIKGAAKELGKEITPPEGKVKRAEEAEIQAQKERERLAQKARREKEEARREEEKARREEERARKEKEKAQREAERLVEKARLEKEKELKRLALEKEKEAERKAWREKEREEARLREKARKDVEEEEKLREAPEVRVSPKKEVSLEGIRNEAIKQFEKGILLYYANKNKEAIDEFQKVIEDYPSVTDVVVKARQYIGFCRSRTKVDKPR